MLELISYYNSQDAEAKTLYLASKEEIETIVEPDYGDAGEDECDGAEEKECDDAGEKKETDRTFD